MKKQEITPSQGRILIVEDDVLISTTVEHRLRFMNYEVAATTTSGEQAIEKAQETQPDLILMDIQLAGDMDGIEAAEQIHARMNVPVIYLTSNNDEETLLRIRGTEPSAYILKPFAEAELRAAVEIALYKVQAERERLQLEIQLRQAQRLEAIGVLAGGIAHDFNNILGTMLGYTELLLAKCDGQGREHEYLEQIYQAGERAEQLVQQILTFSRAQEKQLSPINIAPVVQEALKMLRPIIPSTIQVQQTIAPDCPPILADNTQIHQLVVNLCVNAGHAMRQDGGLLEVGLQPATFENAPEHILQIEAGTYVRLTVKDSGCGMSPELQERIFEPFFTTKAVGEGSGLGLSVVHGIVSGHHGVIHIKSEEGKGTLAQVFFPVSETGLSGTTSSESSESEVLLTSKASILLVDDEPPLAKLYAVALEELGYRVTVLHDGSEALELFQSAPGQFDLVFTDQAMPHMSGTQLSRELLRIKPDIPIILTSGYSESLSEKSMKESGVQRFLMKPVKIRELIQVVRDLLGESE